jgi:hypothetical protein
MVRRVEVSFHLKSVHALNTNKQSFSLPPVGVTNNVDRTPLNAEPPCQDQWEEGKKKRERFNAWVSERQLREQENIGP